MRHRPLSLACALALVSAALSGCGDETPTKSGTKSGAKVAPSPGTSISTPAASPPGAGALNGYGYAATLGDDLDKKVGDALVKGRRFLLTQRDEASGAFDAKGPVATGFTAFGALALIATTAKESVASDPTIRKSLEFVRSQQKPDGSTYSNAQYVNYETSVALAAFATARISDFAGAQGKARDFLAASQIAGDAASVSYGGFPYQSKSDPTAPPDLSNGQFAATALHDAALPADAEVWKRLLAYLDRVQNRSESNKTVIRRADKDIGADVEIVSGDDGGAGYGPGMSKSGLVKRADGKYEVRSYGSMTYALLKCLLFAGAKVDDPRVVAALGWLSKTFTVDRNPGFEATDDPAKKGMQGYYYYLLTMSRALAEFERATGAPRAVTDAKGVAHDWRREVSAKLVSLQRADGSWKNDVERWDEAMPVLATSYAMQALAICQGRLP